MPVGSQLFRTLPGSLPPNKRNLASMSTAGAGDPDDGRTAFWPGIPSRLRIYRCPLDGNGNYPADRQAGDGIAAQPPNIRQAFRWNRTFCCPEYAFLLMRQEFDGLLISATGARPQVAGTRWRWSRPCRRSVTCDHALRVARRIRAAGVGGRARLQ